VAYDYTFSSGSKAGRSSRNSGGRIDTGRITQKRRDTARETPTIQADLSGQAAVAGLAGALGDFFQVQGVEERRLFEEQEKERNAKAISEAHVRMQQDREGTKEAIRTSDFSGFVPEDDLRQRKVVRESFFKMAGAQAGIEDFEATYAEAIRATPHDQDPRQTIQDSLELALKGAELPYAESYTNTVRSLSEKPISQWKDQRQKQVLLDIDKGNTNLVSSLLETGQLTTLTQYHTARKTGGASYPLPPALGDSSMAAILESGLIAKAQSGDEASLNLVLSKDPELDGTTMAGRRKVDEATLLATHIAARQKIPTKRAHDAVTALSVEVARLQAGMSSGSPDDGVSTPENLMVKLRGLVEAHGEGLLESPKFQAIRRRIDSMVEDKSDRTATFEAIAAGRTPANFAAAQKVLTEELGNPTAVEDLRRMMGSGADTVDAVGRMAHGLVDIGLNAAGKTNMTKALMANNADQAKERMQLLGAITAAGGSVRDYLTAGDSGDMALGFYQFARDHPQGFAQAHKTWAEIIDGDIDPVNPLKFYSGRPGVDSTFVGDTMKKVLNPGLFSSQTKISPKLDRAIRRAVNINGWANQNRPHNADEAVAAGKSALALLGTERMGPNGPVWDLRNKPAGIAVNRKTGKSVQVNSTTIEQQKLLGGMLTEDAQDQGMHVTTDPLTKVDGSYAVHDGNGQGIFLQAGGGMPVDVSMKDELWYGSALTFTETDDPNIVMMGYPPAPKAGEDNRKRFNKNFYLEYDSNTRGWTMRARMTEPGVTPVAQLEAERVQNIAAKAKALATAIAIAGSSATAGAAGTPSAITGKVEGLGAATAITTGDQSPEPSAPAPNAKPKDQGVFDPMSNIMGGNVAVAGRVRAAAAEMDLDPEEQEAVIQEATSLVTKKATGASGTSRAEEELAAAMGIDSLATSTREEVEQKANELLALDALAVSERQPGLSGNNKMLATDAVATSKREGVQQSDTDLLRGDALASSTRSPGTRSSEELMGVDAAATEGRREQTMLEAANMASPDGQRAPTPPAIVEGSADDRNYWDMIEAANMAAVADGRMPSAPWPPYTDPETAVIQPGDAEHAAVASGVRDTINAITDDGWADRDTVLNANMGSGVALAQPISPRTKRVDSVARKGEGLFVGVKKGNEERNQYTEAATQEQMSSAATVLLEHINEFEDLVGFAYNDSSNTASPKAWADSDQSVGDPTIGYGFNLTRDDARQMITDVGGDFDAIMANKAGLDPKQALKLYKATMVKTRVLLKNRLGPTVMESLSSNQLNALLSMVYNAGIGKDVNRSIIGTKITKALKRGDWQKVYEEILYNSVDEDKMMANGQGHLIAGLQRRRVSEAFMWMGSRTDPTLFGGM